MLSFNDLITQTDHLFNTEKRNASFMYKGQLRLEGL